MGGDQHLAVPRDARGRTVDDFLRRTLPAATAEHVAELLKAGRVSLGEKPVRSGRKLWGGETLTVKGASPRPAPRVAGPEVRVLAETAALVIAEKPAGQVVEPEPGQVSLVELLASQRPGFDVAGRASPGVAHRLDKQTSGAVAFARTDPALAALRLAFDEGRVDKRYLVIVLGTPPAEGRFDTPYARNPENTRLYTTRVPSARRASLAWRKVEQFKEAALLEITLETGRTHQVRCQFAEAGFPVLGDALYGGREAREHPAAQALGRHALHAARLTVALPEESVSAESPLSADFLSALGALRGKA
ncbi:MAG: hypothetical protein RL653_3018 [Pseudomonadota bacterium]|jgi:23S rRNA pseudouridine1911/1915/1917 synthase